MRQKTNFRRWPEHQGHVEGGVAAPQCEVTWPSHFCLFHCQLPFSDIYTQVREPKNGHQGLRILFCHVQDLRAAPLAGTLHPCPPSLPHHPCPAMSMALRDSRRPRLLSTTHQTYKSQSVSHCLREARQVLRRTLDPGVPSSSAEAPSSALTTLPHNTGLSAASSAPPRPAPPRWGGLRSRETTYNRTAKSGRAHLLPSCKA